MAQDLINFYSEYSYSNNVVTLRNASGSNQVTFDVDRVVNFNSIIGIPRRYSGTDISIVDTTAPTYSTFNDTLTGIAYVKSPLGGWVKTYVPSSSNEFSVELWTNVGSYAIGEVVTGKNGIQYVSNVNGNVEDPTVKVMANTLGTESVQEFSMNGNFITSSEYDDVISITSDTYELNYSIVTKDITVGTPDSLQQSLVQHGNKLNISNGQISVGNVTGNSPSFSYGNFDILINTLYVHNTDDGWIYKMEEGDTYFRKSVDIGKTIKVKFTILDSDSCFVLGENGIDIYHTSNLAVAKFVLPYIATDIARSDNKLYVLKPSGTVSSFVFTTNQWNLLSTGRIFNNSKCVDSSTEVPTLTGGVLQLVNVPSQGNLLDISSIDLQYVFCLYSDGFTSTISKVSLITGIIDISKVINKSITSISLHKGLLYTVSNGTDIDVLDTATLNQVSSFGMSTRISGTIRQIQTIGTTLYVLTSSDALYTFEEPVVNIHDTVSVLENISTFSRITVMHSSYYLAHNYSLGDVSVYQVAIPSNKVYGLASINMTKDDFATYTPFGVWVLNSVTNVIKLYTIEQTRRVL